MTQALTKITGLWRNTDKDGKTYLTGSLTPVSKIVILPNTYKGEDSKAPDYYFFIAPNEKKPEQSGGNL